MLECAVAAGSDAIVTGDSHLLVLKQFRGADIVTVGEFFDRQSNAQR